MKIGFFSVALLASNIAVALPPIDGWYSSIFGGYSNLPKNINTIYQSQFFNNVGYQPGYHAGGRVGYQNNPMRYESEITYINNDIKQFYANYIQQTSVDGQTEDFSAMANVYYDFAEILPCIAPFLGAGIGYSWIRTNFHDNDSPNPIFFHGSNTVFTYQATTGLTYNFFENYALNIAYRYLSTVNADQLGRVFQANLATVGIVFRFDEASYN